MKEIRLREVSSWLTPREASLVYSLVTEELAKHKLVTLDFSGVTMSEGFVRPFLSALYRDYSLVDANRMLKLKGMWQVNLWQKIQRELT